MPTRSLNDNLPLSSVDWVVTDKVDKKSSCREVQFHIKATDDNRYRQGSAMKSGVPLSLDLTGTWKLNGSRHRILKKTLSKNLLNQVYEKAQPFLKKTNNAFFKNFFAQLPNSVDQFTGRKESVSSQDFIQNIDSQQGEIGNIPESDLSIINEQTFVSQEENTPWYDNFVQLDNDFSRNDGSTSFYPQGSRDFSVYSSQNPLLDPIGLLPSQNHPSRKRPNNEPLSSESANFSVNLNSFNSTPYNFDLTSTLNSASHRSTVSSMSKRKRVDTSPFDEMDNDHTDAWRLVCKAS